MMNNHWRGLAHVAIYTKDMEKSLVFYRKLGGMVKDMGHVEKDGIRKELALVTLSNFVIELIALPVPFSESDGSIPHFAIHVDNVDAAAAELEAMGIDTFLSPRKAVLPGLFGGLENRFFRGPSGEEIELVRMLG